MQKEINDLSMTYRTNQIELKRKTDQLDRLEKKHEKLHGEHVELLDAHRSITAEAENLRDDVTHLDEQVKRESDFRKQLQAEKKQMAGQLQTTQVERDTNKLAVMGTQKELKESVEKIVNSVELKAHSQKITMLEKVVADERKERRNLVAETQEVVGKREESLAKLAEKVREIQNLKRMRLEREEEVDRLKVLLKAQEQRNLEQLVTVDKYQSSVANHEAEMRQMQVLLECERDEGRRQLKEMEDIQTVARQTMEFKIEQWKMCFEDVFSRMNFNPLTNKLQTYERQIEELQEEKADIASVVIAQKEQFMNVEEDVHLRDQQIKDLEHESAEAKRETKLWIARHAEAVDSYNREGLKGADLEGEVTKLKALSGDFDQLKAHYESRIEDIKRSQVTVTHKTVVETCDNSCQASISTKGRSTQTDLSYQYLESNVQTDRARRERLSTVKQASHFVQDPEQARDFQFSTAGLSKTNVTKGAAANHGVSFDVGLDAMGTTMSTKQRQSQSSTYAERQSLTASRGSAVR